MSDFATPWTVARQVPLSMGFPKQEYWSGLPHSPPGDLPDPGIEPTFLVSPALAGRFFTSATWEAPTRMVRGLNHNIKHTEITDTATRHSVRCFRHGISVNIYTNNRKKCLHLHCTDEEVGIQREKVFITTRLVCGDSWI